jgi:hypothetical protein
MRDIVDSGSRHKYQIEITNANILEQDECTPERRNRLDQMITVMN